ncbi:MAG: biofilm regulation protein kinase SiaB [Methylococcales bacterium]|nr:biofilm regulation protein kinase SiaB [Methylococcales bacterium]
MQDINLLSLRSQFIDKRILLCFNGPISSGLIQELGQALKNYLHSDLASPSLSMDVFAVYIELTQNISHYVRARGYDEAQSLATVVVGRGKNQGYQVLAGNMIEPEDGERMRLRIQELAQLDKTELKQRYKQQLRQPREQHARTGAGLGLIDVCRKSTQPLACELVPSDAGKAFLSILATL